MYLRKVPDELLCLQSNLHDTETFANELKARVKTKKTGPTELLITITNLTALDTGFYHCEFVVFEAAKPIKTIGEGSVLLVVHGELYFEFTTRHYVCFFILFLHTCPGHRYKHHEMRLIWGCR